MEHSQRRIFLEISLELDAYVGQPYTTGHANIVFIQECHNNDTSEGRSIISWYFFSDI